jgi:cyclophilin family peptidyl-prolyl cis-trans isomerase
MKKAVFYLAIIILTWASCMPYEEDTETSIKLDYSKKELQQLMDFKDKRQTDSLKTYLDSRNPTYRYVAALGIASSKDSNALELLYPLLSDPVDNVRGAAAFAVGQIGDTLSTPKLLAAFNGKDSLRQYNNANGQILEAVGKCGKIEQLAALATVGTYNEKDTLLLLGQARGIYRFALRKIVHPAGTKLMMDYAINEKYPYEVRLMGAQYLHRAKGIAIDSSIAEICANIKQETNPNIRMALVTGIAKSKMDFARDTLISLFNSDDDYRVKCNIIRAFSFFEYVDVANTIFNALKDKNPHVAYVAAEYFYYNGKSDDGKIYKNIAKEAADWRLKAKLYAASNKNLSVYYTQAKSSNTLELTNLFNETENIHEKVAILDAMAEFEWTYPQMKALGLDNENPVLKTAGSNGLAKIIQSESFDQVFGIGKNRVRNEISSYLVEAIKSKDAGSIAVAAAVIADPKMNFKTYFAESGFLFLDTILQALPLPREIETYKELEKAIHTLRDIEKKSDIRPDYNHPIEWDMVEVLSSRTRGIIQTNKGKIVVEFFPQSSPGSTSNFIRLTKDGYYDGKVIHRVVPNFVVQGGCNRGDGYGSEDFSIRSEFSNLYYNDEGYLGMASAGNDTESTQWFITHSPTPHLDGNYTIFGKVKEGMDIVHKLQIGDKIEKAVIRF